MDRKMTEWEAEDYWYKRVQEVFGTIKTEKRITKPESEQGEMF